MKPKLNNLFKKRTLLIGTTIIGVFFAIMVLSYFWTPNDPLKSYDAVLGSKLMTYPSRQFPLGTDNLGRCILSRIMYSLRSVFIVGISSVSISLFFGGLLGLISGYFGKRINEYIMRIMDMIMVIPDLLLILMFVSLFGNSRKNLIFTIGFLGIPYFTKIIRGKVLEVKSKDYILWSKVIGVGHTRTIFYHILPEILPVIFVSIALRISSAILTESSLSYLGFSSADYPSLGKIISDGQIYLTNYPLYPIMPGLVLALLVFGFNMISDGLNQYYSSLKD